MPAMKRFAMIAAASLALAACSDDPAPAEGEEENLDARGEVLGGTISDDMLPLDTVTSQSPSQAEESIAPAASSTPAASQPVQETPAEAAQPADPSEDDLEPAE
ncbi:hypothetical protein K3152_07795 [Qipengyuania sp. 1NDH17]|uniref:Lipoprotein n=1 Tax=Qipengyuania polymorpha TaxID=2867234 RepID=A0ABS7J0Q0_9SPHN|nr:hypothetical protein [Qipengyuania polymorpha]MBX7458145.1 hypothetical protein [Qipengyuania polymorpha]